MGQAKKSGVTYSAALEHLSALAVRGSIPLVLISLYSILQLFRYGPDNHDYLVLLVGSVISGAAIIGYVISILVYGLEGKRSYVAMFLTFFGFIPWIFGSYLVLYKGFWSLKDLIDDFSFIVLLKSAFYIVFGYIVVSKFYQITEFGRKIDRDK